MDIKLKGEYSDMKHNNIHDYDDIITMPHHVSKKHPQMMIVNRAAQFAPFAALTGHKQAIMETERLTDRKIVLDENKKALLNETLQALMNQIQEHPNIEVTYYIPDIKKEGGMYVTSVNRLKRIDEYEQRLIFMDRTSIALDDVYEIEQIAPSHF